MKRKLSLVIVTMAIAKSITAFSQEPNLRKKWVYKAELATFLSNGKGTFWQQANQNAEVPEYKYANARAKATFSKSYANDSLGSRKIVDWGVGATAILSASKEPTLFFSQLYAQARVWKIELSLGRRYENIGLIDQELSSGSYSFSNNALPIPKVQLSSLGFLEAPFTKRLLAFKFNYADGLIGKTQADPFNRFVNIEETFLHQKSLYGRLGKPQWKVNFYGGFSHQVMWGGEYQIWPTGFLLTRQERYFGVVQGEPWSGSRIGNHVANIDLAFSYRSKKADWFFYRQNLVEDGSLFRGLSNITDGLNGVSAVFKNFESKKSYIKKVTLEVLSTFNQGGVDVDFTTGKFGADDYFNHYIYLSGWSYGGRTLGTPFIPPTTTTNQTLPQSANFTNNNRLFLLHLGLKGVVLEKYQFLTKLSFSSNSGTFVAPFPSATNQFSGLVQMSRKSSFLRGSELIGSLSLDVGKLYPNRVGLYIGIRKSGNF